MSYRNVDAAPDLAELMFTAPASDLHKGGLVVENPNEAFQ